MTSDKENEFFITLAHLAQHFVNFSYEGDKIGRRIFIINHIGNSNMCNMTDIVESLKLPKSTATRQVDYLVKRHLVNRKISDENRRTVELSLTDKGKEIYSWIQSHLANVLTTLTQEYSENELNLLLRLLPRLVYHSEEILRKTSHWR